MNTLAVLLGYGHGAIEREPADPFGGNTDPNQLTIKR
jgi:hypothetical protein